MATYRDVKGMSVISLAEGKKVGQVADLVVDPQARAVRWLRVGRGAGGSLFGGRSDTTWVRTSTVHSVGEHAITINRESDMLQADAEPEAAEAARSARALLGKKVLTEGGQFLGETRDFTFSPDDFRLRSILVEQGSGMFSQQKPVEIDANDLRTIGEDMIVVADTAAAAVNRESHAATRERDEPRRSTTESTVRPDVRTVHDEGRIEDRPGAVRPAAGSEHLEDRPIERDARSAGYPAAGAPAPAGLDRPGDALSNRDTDLYNEEDEDLERREDSRRPPEHGPLP